jgi:acyl-CoA thioesterase-1
MSFHKFLGIAGLLIALILSGCASANPSSQQTTTSPQTGSPTPIKLQPTPGFTFKKPIIYVALGASDAVGVGSNIPGSQGYVPLVAARLPKGSHMVNLGVSGILLHDALTEELPLALSLSPDLITVWLVANDFIGGVTYSDYMQDLNNLFTQLRSRTHAHIVMANLPDLTRLPAFANQTSAQRTQMFLAITQWNTGIARQAGRYGVTLVDLFSQGSQLTAHPEYISGDGFHPSPSGYVQLANLFWQAIGKL